MKKDEIEVQYSPLLYMQRLVASNKVHGATNGRFNMFFVLKKVPNKSSLSVGNLYSCWFGKILCFVRIATTAEDSSLCGDHKKYKCQNCHHQPHNELCFVPQYEILNRAVLPNETLMACRIAFSLGGNERRAKLIYCRQARCLDSCR